MKENILDRLATAFQADKGMRLTAVDVGDILEGFAELEFALQLDATLIRFVLEDDEASTQH